MQRGMIIRGLTMAAVAAALVVGTARPARAQDAELVKKGQQVYNAQKCQMCHSIAGKGSKTSPLDGVGSKLSADEIRSWIVDPVAAAKKAGSTKKPPMPNKYKLPPAELDALVAYMSSLKK
jgi:mono/diheme cytochrome c family protein